MITQKRVLELFDYQDGVLYWKAKPSKRSHMNIGDKVGNTGSRYLNTKILRKCYQVHRLIFLYHHGYLPEFIDHIDENKTNNNISNLREATKSQNNTNSSIRKDNKSGVKGVSWDKKSRVWVAQLQLNNKARCLGRFWDIYTAELTVKRERLKLHKNFANHGKNYTND